MYCIYLSPFTWINDPLHSSYHWCDISHLCHNMQWSYPGWYPAHPMCGCWDMTEGSVPSSSEASAIPSAPSSTSRLWSLLIWRIICGRRFIYPPRVIASVSATTISTSSSAMSTANYGDVCPAIVAKVFPVPSAKFFCMFPNFNSIESIVGYHRIIVAATAALAITATSAASSLESASTPTASTPTAWAYFWYPTFIRFIGFQMSRVKDWRYLCRYIGYRA